MVTRTATKNEEPANYAKPSEGTTHLFQIVDCWDIDNQHPKIALDENTVLVKLEVKGGEEEGRTMLHRVSLDDKWTGFFRTQIFLKCIGEPYKGEDFPIMSENWHGREFYATVEHTTSEKTGKTYPNILDFDEDKSKTIKQFIAQPKSGQPLTEGWDD
jgi:hypothetical protein